jgi:hypothetical protein
LQSLRKAFVDKGEDLVDRNRKAVYAAITNLDKIEAPFATWTSDEKV